MLKRLIESTRGAVAVELAVMSPFIVLLIVGAWDMGRYINDSAALTNLSRTGAQYAISKFWDPAYVKAAVEAEATRQTETGVTVTVNAICQCSGGSTVSPCTAASTCPSGESLKIYSQTSASRGYASTLPIPADWGGTFTIDRSATVRVR